jgi:ketosteroid isomerase-like protein
MSSIHDPQQFSREWVQAWNDHDVEAVLRHFHDDAVFTSPVALRIVPESGGIIRGKPALRAYWTEALRHAPNLHFDLESIYVGVNALVIHYRKQSGLLANEVLIFEGERVKAGYATHLRE